MPLPDRVRRSTPLIVAALGLVGASQAPVPPLPRAVRRAVDAAYPGWRFATIIPELRRELAPGQRPEWVSGDFDGDGRRDYAVQIVWAEAPPPQDSSQLTVALLRRPRGYARHVVHATGIHDGIWLARGRRGSRNCDFEADTEFVYRTDAIEIGYGQEAGETCLFLRSAFRCLITSN